MTTLILDSNALFAAVYRTPGFAIPLDGPFEEVMVLVRLGEIRVVVSELCIHETERRIRRECDRACSSRRRAARARAQLGLSEDASAADVAERLGSWRERFESVLTEHGVEVAAVPEIDQSQILQRLLREQRPFTGKGDEGYRDCLVWETAIREARGSRSAILVSHDLRAFADPKEPSALHPTLQQEAEGRLAGVNALVLATTLDAALNHMQVERPDRSLTVTDELIADLIVEISREAVDLDGEPGPELRSLLGGPVELLRLERLVDLRDVAVLRGRRRLIRADLTFDALVHAQIPEEPSDALIGLDLEECSPGLTTSDWLLDFTHPIEVRAEATVGASGEIIEPRLVSWRLLLSGPGGNDTRQLQLH